MRFKYSVLCFNKKLTPASIPIVSAVVSLFSMQLFIAHLETFCTATASDAQPPEIL